jgi:hypothetical protein
VKRAALRCALPILAALAGCGGHDKTARIPRGAGSDLATPFVEAMREEAKGDPAKATSMYLSVLDAAVQSPDNPWQLTVEQAALDALVWRTIPALGEASEDGALVYRTKDTSLASPHDKDSIAGRLTAIAGRAEDPFSAGLIARAMEELAEHRGDAADAEKWRAVRGCAREATMIGPLTWTSVTGVGEKDPLEAADARIEAAYATPGAFARKTAPARVDQRGCGIDLGSVSTNGGVRDVVVDVEIKTAQRIGVALRAHGAATLRAGGRVAIERSYDLGGGVAARFARVDAGPGTLRLVARVGMDDETSIEIDAWDEHGHPLPMHAPKVGDAATVKARGSEAIAYPAPTGDVQRAALAAGALAAGDGRIAEQITAADAAREGAAPELLLAYARAVETARDLDPVHRAERARGAYERVLDAWPAAWEAIVAHAVLAGVRRGQGEARIEALKDLEQHRAKAGASALPILDVFDAATSGRDHLYDRAKVALERARAALPKTSIVRDAARAVTPRTGAENVAVECAADADVDRSRLDCYDAIRQTGDRAGAAKELDRLRAVLGAPRAFLAVSMREALSAGDGRAAAQTFDVMLPGERTLAALYGIAPIGLELPADMAKLRRDQLLALAPIARDAPSGIPPLMRALSDDPTAPFAGIAEKITADDRATPILPSAATAVLAHVERYDIDPSGLVRFVLFDVRRVSGTTDVEENAQASPPDVGGRTSMRILRRRIFKKDGRVIEPDRTPNASQSHADLSQLEQGDAVEAIYEGWSLPGETGDIHIDTPDLLPERTAVHDATIELRLPAALRGSMWTHPLLGKVTEATEGDRKVLRWRSKDTPVRRIEDGTPKMDRDVSMSFSTSVWSDTALALRETLATLADHDPEITKWAREAAKGKTAPKEIIDAVVDAAGTTVKEASPSTLSDLEIGRPGGAQSVTARTILSNNEGSRTWLVTRALRELGVSTDVVIAENEPFSASATFPPHYGRFTHPLAVAHVPGDKTHAASDVWIDADVPGPPLPAGRISPELRGRSAIHADGTIAPLPSLAGADGSERDEVDIRLTVDAKGDAKGSLTILLRGRAAQELAEVLVRIVGDERQRALRGVALAWVPFANVDDVALSSSEGSWQVALRAALTIPAYAQPEGGTGGTAKSWVLPGIDPMHIVYPRPYVTTLGATYASRGSRQEALAVNRALQYHARRRVELPAGTAVVRVPGAFAVSGAILQASRKIGVASNVIEEEFTLSVSTGTIPASAYGAFVTDAHKTDDAFLASTRVKP